jgi:phospholipase C
MRTRTGLWLLAASFVTVGCGSAASDVDTTATLKSSLSTESVAGADGGSGASGAPGDAFTTSPIKHVIVIIGENRTFDHLFATYKSPSGDYVDNLLSKKIIKADGSPGPNFARSHQFTAVDAQPSPYEIAPGSKALYGTLPPPHVPGYDATAPFTTVADAMAAENGLESQDYVKLTTGGTGSLVAGATDTRIPNVNSLLPGVFQITGPNMTDDDYAASPVHRFYQMWQQLDCDAAAGSLLNPAGCRDDLFAWVEQTIAAGSNGNPEPSTFTGEGSTALEFYNMQEGDLAYTRSLADQYSMSDNYHQAVQGGTGANHVMMMSGDAIWYSDGHGNAAVPPNNQIENPDPAPGTNNWYTQDGYSGGTYSECADETQPGVTGVTSYLHELHIDPNCQKGHYYLLNNYAPGYYGDGTPNPGASDPNGFVIPPSTLRTIGDELLERNISWAYFGDQFDNYVADHNLYDSPSNNYCDICNAFQYSSNIMTNAAVRTAHLKDTIDLYAGIAAGTLPAVSFVKPSGLLDGHPASSKWDLYEGFVKKIVDLVKADPKLWDSTAILMTADEGGGYYDSGYVQPLDFFGDGTRIPMIAISKYSTGGHVSHTYTDHASILKFIERNWALPPVTNRSRDNLPNPIQIGYAPLNGAAIGDLFDLFSFGRFGH